MRTIIRGILLALSIIISYISVEASPGNNFVKPANFDSAPFHGQYEPIRPFLEGENRLLVERPDAFTENLGQLGDGV